MEGKYLIMIGVLIHLVFLMSIFDIYFTSPIVHGMKSHPMPANPPAQRLCLIVSDGLRADKFFGGLRMPFLHGVAKNLGVSGISHTRVPTESRPGHVAIIAGFYEDVSAVTKGWKENPVEFDSVFNQSRFTFAWGSPDIVDIFTRIRGEDGRFHKIPHIFGNTYSAEFEDFAGSPMVLDSWVSDEFSKFLSEAKSNSTLNEMVNQDKIIFFFHLLGMILLGFLLISVSKASRKSCCAWLIACGLMAIFPCLEVVGTTRNNELILFAFVLGIALSGFQIWLTWRSKRNDLQTSAVLNYQSATSVICGIIIWITTRSVAAQSSPGIIIHATSWSVLVLGFIIPFFGTTLLRQRFFNVISSLSTSYLLMTVSYEGIFIFVFSLFLYFWVELESHTETANLSLSYLTIYDSRQMHQSSEFRTIKWDDVRRAYFYIFFILLAFFGTGNIASVNSFDPTSALSFVTVFRPFVMGTILMCKLFIPFFLVGCAFHMVHVVCRVPMSGLLLIVLLISDFMALHFFFFVKTEGSWLDIGTSISHYVIVMGCIVFTFILSVISSLMMSVRINIPFPPIGKS